MLTEGERVVLASRHMAEALQLLGLAKTHLLHAKSDQHAPLAFQLANIEEIHGILMDPECTPEIVEVDRDDS